MTIKTRNRLNLSLFVVSLVFLFANILILFISLYKNSFTLDLSSFIPQDNPSFFLTQYNPTVVIIALFFQIVYVCITSFMLFRVFEKTQASDISYFYLFLIALLANSLRLWIPLFNLGNSYSSLMVFCGKSVVFSKMLVPLSLLFSVVMAGIDQRQDLEKNIFILLLGCIFFSQLIPLNTANICSNFEVDYSYRNVIRISSVLVILAMLIALFFNNLHRLYTQITTIGLALISTGTFILFNSCSILFLGIAFILLLVGNILYLKELHKQYLWNDA